MTRAPADVSAFAGEECDRRLIRTVGIHDQLLTDLRGDAVAAAVEPDLHPIGLSLGIEVPSAAVSESRRRRGRAKYRSSLLEPGRFGFGVSFGVERQLLLGRVVLAVAPGATGAVLGELSASAGSVANVG